MFEQHPVPQNISSYQFHLVGDMTLKQFLELAAGVVVGVLFYATGLPGLIKWPLILFSAGFGAALAFVPFEERPLEQWIFAFLRSVYSPTLFHWEKNDTVKYFQEEQPGAGAPLQTKAGATVNATAPKLDTAESSYLSRVMGLFNPVSAPALQAPVQQPTTQSVQINIPKPTPTPAPVQPTQVNQQKTVTIEAPSVTSMPNSVNIPQTTFVTVGNSLVNRDRPQLVVEESQATPNNLQETPIAQTLPKREIPQASAAQFSINAAPPSLPTIIDTISGQVMDHEGNIIEGAILEIVDVSGRPVRALRTNKAGHFLIVTPLPHGTYKIIMEKEGFTFDPIEFEAKGEIIQPIAIHAK